MKSVFVLLLTTTCAFAQQIPTEEEKIAALKLAYELNGCSMVRFGSSIDLTTMPKDAVKPDKPPVQTRPCSDQGTTKQNR